MNNLIVTGGAGFIGCWFVRKALSKGYRVCVLDKLTYSGNLANLEDVKDHPNYNFVKGDICDKELVTKLIQEYTPKGIINFAAESHVDNSISGPAPFVQTNVIGTFNLLDCSLNYYNSLERSEAENFKFIQISTDEVYGSLTKDEPAFTSRTQYAPNSPYSATKASADHLARAWYETYGLPVIVTNCSNNYGPNQHAEKLIPKVITNALTGKDIPIYAKGENIRDWIYVEDHADGIMLALEKGIAGKKYLFGGDKELKNIEVVDKICKILEEKTGINARGQIKYVTDRLGHDYRYAINSEESKHELGFIQKHSFDDAIKNTINWYISSNNSLSSNQLNFKES